MYILQCPLIGYDRGHIKLQLCKTRLKLVWKDQTWPRRDNPSFWSFGYKFINLKYLNLVSYRSDVDWARFHKQWSNHKKKIPKVYICKQNVMKMVKFEIHGYKKKIFKNWNRLDYKAKTSNKTEVWYKNEGNRIVQKLKFSFWQSSKNWFQSKNWKSFIHTFVASHHETSAHYMYI